jgi:hypothetical protein
VSSLLFIATPATVKKIDKSRLTELDSSTLVDLIKDYMNENQVPMSPTSFYLGSKVFGQIKKD